MLFCNASPWAPLPVATRSWAASRLWPSDGRLEAHDILYVGLITAWVGREFPPRAERSQARFDCAGASGRSEALRVDVAPRIDTDMCGNAPRNCWTNRDRVIEAELDLIELALEYARPSANPWDRMARAHMESSGSQAFQHSSRASGRRGTILAPGLERVP